MPRMTLKAYVYHDRLLKHILDVGKETTYKDRPDNVYKYIVIGLYVVTHCARRTEVFQVLHNGIPDIQDLYVAGTDWLCIAPDWNHCSEYSNKTCRQHLSQVLSKEELQMLDLQHELTP